MKFPLGDKVKFLRACILAVLLAVSPGLLSCHHKLNEQERLLVGTWREVGNTTEGSTLDRTTTFRASRTYTEKGEVHHKGETYHYEVEGPWETGANIISLKVEKSNFSPAGNIGEISKLHFHFLDTDHLLFLFDNGRTSACARVVTPNGGQ